MSKKPAKKPARRTDKPKAEPAKQAAQPVPSEQPPEVIPSVPPSVSDRPTQMYGDTGDFVKILQQCLQIDVDGQFGKQTEDAVFAYQNNKHITPDGVVGPDTWAWLEHDYHLPQYPVPLLPPLSAELTKQITNLALASPVADYEWRDRGVAPTGYTAGMALSWAIVYRNYQAGDTSAIEMGKASGPPDKDALAWLGPEFFELRMLNNQPGADTLRHLFVLLMGLGMRESSGQHCEGRDMSADNVTSETAEAGLFRMSWNASGCSDEMHKLMDQFQSKPPQCLLETYASPDVECSSSDWQSYGSGEGRVYQDLAKTCPQFAVECAGIGLRNLRQHWGPINRKEVELLPEVDMLFQQIQTLLNQVAA
jgi:hypothetical protein